MASDGQKAGATAHKGVTEKLLGQLDLGKEKVALPITTSACAVSKLFLVAKYLAQPRRPASPDLCRLRQITEYASTCSVPIVHEAGDLSIESHLSHWWKNTSAKPDVLISADIAADPKDHNM